MADVKNPYGYKTAGSEYFALDTSNMESSMKACETLAKKLDAVRFDADRIRDILLTNWRGEGRKEFETQFRLLSQQFSDITEDVWEFYEIMREALDEYMLVDMELAQAEEGVSNYA